MSGDRGLFDIGCLIVGFEGVSFSFWCLVVFVFDVVSIYMFSEVGM